mgnify:CR=1 FL=1
MDQQNVDCNRMGNIPFRAINFFDCSQEKGREMSVRKSRAFSFMEGQELRGADRSHSVHAVFDSCNWPGAPYDSV